MHPRRHFVFTLGLVIAGLGVSILFASADTRTETERIRVGMAKSFFNDIPKIWVDLVIDPFKPMMKSTTGLDGELLAQYDAFEVAKKLNENHLQFGVFHGHEFAWVQHKYPDLRPLMVAVNKHREVRSFFIVRKDNPAKMIGELRGKNLALAVGTKQHCRVHMERMCADNDRADPNAFFGQIVRSASAEEALDDLCRNKAHVAIVDTIALEFYKEIKEFCYSKNLRILHQSAPFPFAVIVHKQGALTNEVLTKFTDGLLRAHKTDVGRDMMKMWRIAAFERVPSNYGDSLAEVLKAFPPPEAMKVSLR